MTEDKELNNKLYDLALEKNHGVPAPRGFGHHIDGLKDKISDLEAKLAESEKKLDLEKYAPVFCRFTGRSCDAIKKIDQLKQQLAEKDEEIEDVKAVLFAQKLDKEYTQILAIQNCEQEKISFCIEQLEKVKEIISFKPPMQTYEEIIKTFMFRIDNQIKQLKEGK